MKTRRINLLEQVRTPGFDQLMAARAFRLLGMMWRKRISWYRDPLTLDLVFTYE